MHRSTFGCVLFALALPVTSVAQTAAPAPYQVPGSADTNFNIECFEGGERVWGVYKRNGISHWSVARDIWLIPQVSGQPIISFKRGFTTADTDATYLPSSAQSCEISEQR